MSDVLINFVGHTEALQPAEQALDNIIAKEGAIGETWKKTSDTMTTESKKSVESTNKLAKSIEAMATAAKSMDKVVIGGAYKQYLKEIQAALGLTNKELIVYVQNARKAAQESIFAAETDQEIADITLSIEAMNEQLLQLGAGEEELGQKTSSLRTRLREAKEELVALADAGITSGPAFDAAKKKAGDLDDQMRDLNATIRTTGSDTRHLDGLISLAGGVAGGFAVAQGAAALFGSKNEEVQKALLKVNAAMSILQGLQMIQNVLQKESAASLLFGNMQRTTAVTTTVAQTVATEGAVVAQTKLNTAMSLNPIGLIILGVTALIAALSYFDDSVEDSAKTVEYFDGVLKNLNNTLSELERFRNAQANLSIANLQKQNALQSTIQREQLNGIKENIQSQLQLADQTNSLYQQFRKDAADGKFTKDDFKKQNDAFYQQQQENGQKIFQLRSELAVAEINLAKQTQEEILASNTASAEADLARKKLAIINNQVDSLAAIEAIKDAEINAIRAKVAEELKTKANTPGERARIIANANLQIAEKEKAFQVKLLEIDKAGLNSKLLLAQKGTEQEYELKTKMLEQQQNIELAATELTQQQIAEIKARYQVQQLDLDRQFAEQRIQDEISFLNAYLDEFDLAEDRKLELTIRRLNRQRDLEISQAEDNGAKIKEINAKYDKQILEAKKAFINAVLAEQVRTLNVFTAISNASYQRTLANDKASVDSKLFASKMILKHELDLLMVEKAAIDKHLKDKVLSQEEYNLKLQEYFNKREAATLASEERITKITLAEIQKRTDQLQSVLTVFQKGLSATLGTSALSVALTELTSFAGKVREVFDKIKEGQLTTMEGIKELATAAIAAAQTAINHVFADASAKRQQIAADEIAALEEQKQRELAVKNLTEQQKADIENRYRQMERRIKIEAFNADKEAKRSQALINAALGATLAIAEYPWPYSLVVAGIVAGLAGIQVAEINRQQPPRFRHGKVDIDGPGTNTSDSIPAWISKGESVINADATAKWKGALEAMNTGKFDDYLLNKFQHFIFPTLPDDAGNSGNGTGIDYMLLAKAVAAEMKGIIPAPAQVTNTMDAEGLHSFVQNGNSRTEIKNKRYSMS